MYLKARVLKLIQTAIEELRQTGFLTQDFKVIAELDRPATPEHGDYATNLAMQSAKKIGQPPRIFAEKLVEKIRGYSELIEKIQIAGPGFINFYLKPRVLFKEIQTIIGSQKHYGESDWGQGRKILLEFVSANPVGPLNVVSARAAAVGDSLARILNNQGVKASKEYYINDAGNQAQLLGESLYARWLQSKGKEVSVPEQGYQGEYIITLAKEIVADNNEEKILALKPQEAIAFFRKKGVERLVFSHKQDLESFGVEFDNWFYESQLYKKEKVKQALNELEKKGYVYEKEGASWFKSTELGDDKDRVLIKNNGEPAYLAADIAYHKDKFERGYQELIDLWGPDHHGYIGRLQAAIQALGFDKKAFQVYIVQQVNLLEAGKPVAMSKRAGRFVTMADLLTEVGKDVARFFFLMRSKDAHLDFYLDLARKQTEDNPVFYIQYAHARICSILNKSKQENIAFKLEDIKDTDYTFKGEEISLMRDLVAYPEILETCARTLEPHTLAFMLRDIATSFHRFYTMCKVINKEDMLTTKFRLILTEASKIILKNGLELLGISAPASM